MYSNIPDGITYNGNGSYSINTSQLPDYSNVVRKVTEDIEDLLRNIQNSVYGISSIWKDDAAETYKLKLENKIEKALMNLDSIHAVANEMMNIYNYYDEHFTKLGNIINNIDD